MTKGERDEDVVLGADVTELAQSKHRAGTMVLSIRLNRGEVAEVEALSDTRGVSMSDVMREAVRFYLRQYRTVTLTSPRDDGNFVMPGSPTLRGEAAGAGNVEVDGIEPTGHSTGAKVVFHRS